MTSSKVETLLVDRHRWCPSGIEFIWNNGDLTRKLVYFRTTTGIVGYFSLRNSLKGVPENFSSSYAIGQASLEVCLLVPRYVTTSDFLGDDFVLNNNKINVSHLFWEQMCLISHAIQWALFMPVKHATRETQVCGPR